MNRKLTIDEILEKQFRTKKIGGLDATDVDAFLNDIIEDYEYFDKSIIDLKKQLEVLREENFKIKMNILNNNSQSIDITQDIEIQKLANDRDTIVSENVNSLHYDENLLPDDKSSSMCNNEELVRRLNHLEEEIEKIKEHTIKLDK